MHQTMHLLTPANAKHLLESIAHADAGQVFQHDLPQP